LSDPTSCVLKRLFRLLLLALCAFLAATYYFATQPVALKSSPLDFEVNSGLGLRATSRAMTAAGIDMAPWQFTLLGRLLGKATEIKAGSYQVENGVTPYGLLKKLTRGDTSQAEVVLIEGKTFADLKQQLDTHPDVRHDSAAMTEAELLAALDIREGHPEGQFFPDTYLFSKNASDIDILRRAHKNMSSKLAEEWNEREPGLPYQTPYEALIMASIVEKETGNEADRGQIAAVFVNRLRTGMMLQTDPSVIYGVKVFDGNLRKSDLLADTAYNTYRHAGLPPTPIAMPGQASLHAALHPPASDNYYFVARGDGSSVFSRTLEEHNRAVARYQKRKDGAG
jgi:UPF0755 protein